MSDYTYNPAFVYEVNMCAMKVDPEGGSTYTENENADHFSVYVREIRDDHGIDVHILEDEKLIDEEAAGKRASELIAKYGGEEKCGFESY